ncbi:MAG: fused MFS/spermidine synthase [Firmicutes bacterium]|nr:fused MFS/spermidine synthase [Bacillota bacterium]
MPSRAWKWFIEYTHPTQAHMHGVDRYIYSGKTAFQRVEIIDTDFFGRCLILDGKIQSSQFDEYIYHEALIHPAMVLHPEPKKIFVAGGGEGAVLREILKHRSVEKLVMVDIDKETVELCKQYLPQWSQGTFEDPRVEVLYMDARKYLEENTEQWDIIFLDLPEPLDNGPCYLLFTTEFYKTVAERLRPGGHIALQADNLNPKLFQCHAAIYNTLKRHFKIVDSYGTYIPSFDTEWGFIFASQTVSALDFSNEKINSILEEREITDLRFYDGLTHQALFSLTKDIRFLRSQSNRIIEDNNPLFST